MKCFSSLVRSLCFTKHFTRLQQEENDDEENVATSVVSAERDGSNKNSRYFTTCSNKRNIPHSSFALNSSD